MNIKDLHKILSEIVEEHGEAEIFFDVEARSYDYHMATVNSAYLEKEPEACLVLAQQNLSTRQKVVAEIQASPCSACGSHLSMAKIDDSTYCYNCLRFDDRLRVIGGHIVWTTNPIRVADLAEPDNTQMIVSVIEQVVDGQQRIEQRLANLEAFNETSKPITSKIAFERVED